MLSGHLTATSFYSGAHLAAQFRSLGWTMSSWIRIDKRVCCNKNVMVYIKKKLVGGGGVCSGSESKGVQSGMLLLIILFLIIVIKRYMWTINTVTRMFCFNMQ